MSDGLRTRAEASLARGLEQSAAGETADLGDFTQYVDDQDALRTRAREAADKWQDDQGFSYDIPSRSRFIAGYLAHAAQQPTREHVYVQVAARKAGKNSALADAIVERANAQGLRVEFVTPSPTREQIARVIGSAANPTQVGFGVVGIEAAINAVLALLDGTDR